MFLGEAHREEELPDSFTWPGFPEPMGPVLGTGSHGGLLCPVEDFTEELGRPSRLRLVGSLLVVNAQEHDRVRGVDGGRKASLWGCWACTSATRTQYSWGKRPPGSEWG